MDICCKRDFHTPCLASRKLALARGFFYLPRQLRQSDAVARRRFTRTTRALARYWAKLSPAERRAASIKSAQDVLKAVDMPGEAREDDRECLGLPAGANLGSARNARMSLWQYALEREAELLDRQTGFASDTKDNAEAVRLAQPRAALG